MSTEWKRVRSGEFFAFTTDTVFLELGERLHRLNLTEKTLLAVSEILHASLLRFARVPAALLATAASRSDLWAQRKKNPKRRLGYVDCVNVEVMKALGVTRVLATDGDYAAEGLEVIPAVR